MPTLSSHQLSFQLETGEWLFKNININITQGVTGLVGRNGSGKTVLLEILRGALLPTSGSVTCHEKLGYYSQLPSHLLNEAVTVSDFLGLTQKRFAVKSIEQGSVELQYFELVGEDWDIEAQSLNLMKTLGLPADLDARCASLSGGQLALLQLHQLFESDIQILLLDEPSNHLDQAGKEWLKRKIACFQGAILLVSHDRLLLRDVDAIYHLTSLGVSYFKGNYDEFSLYNQQQENALTNKINQLKSERKKIERQAQINQEKAQQRAAQGNRIRKSGSQPKILMDAMKGKAEKTRSAALTNQNNQLERTQNKLSELEKQKERLKPQAMYLQNSSAVKRRTLVALEDCVLDFGAKRPITASIVHSDRVYLQGRNGSGKSTLLKAVFGEHCRYQGVLKVNTKTVYLDQHFGLLKPDLSLLENLTQYCTGLTDSEARTLLAGIGFRRDSVYRYVKHLSGGEKMKLSMLVVSHIEGAPLLLLDEPDNHLDIESKQLLASALKRYQGSFIVVSHDHDFVQDIGVNRHLFLEDES
ncbi:ABC-F family ATP-binding cassette domain-containing protein [Vibrio sp. T187]|uniref:ATP-binding cassette domain-containing protein n=1 Tax=Vibrio TaxID=662 RepID=UPI0010C9B978|nr:MULTISPECIES: ATP-binding cassette domain-containing protein [Vibrio]MBW3695837.1 ABC-F family ATP-binding cassette domain-containing protein [Vibrio sp. T187]